MPVVRVGIVVAAAVVAMAALVSPNALRSALATSASSLFEATPFLLAGIGLWRVLGGRTGTAFFGCGCGTGPSARSLPAAAATWLVFGPAVATLRFLAAVAVAHLVSRRARAGCDGCDRGAAHAAAPSLLEEFAALLPAALCAGAAMQIESIVDASAIAPWSQVVAGAVFGALAAPCGLGAVAVAGALHARAPLAAASFLCIAGIVDVRAFAPQRRPADGEHDVLAYTLACLALGIVGLRHGDALVHPGIAAALTACSVLAAGLAVVHRRRRGAARVRVAPALMLLGALTVAPAPVYRATETTLSDLFPGEHLRFIGAIARNGATAALVRYAITCCRADAAPVVVRLTHAPAFPAGTWLRVDGIVTTAAGRRRLAPQHVDRVAPPSDPFIYR
jgi:hypothetical protein